MQLDVLSVCRQMNTEASATFWMTNIFDFDDPDHLKYFMMETSMRHKRMIRSLRLEMQFDYGEAWSSVLDRDLVSSLSGLRTLRLNVEVYGAADWYLIATGYKRRFHQGLRRMSILPLTRIEVGVHAWPNHTDWTDADKEELSNDLRSTLVNT